MAGIDNVYFNIKSERHSYYQALLSLGDRRVAPAIEAAERNGQNWRAAVAEAGVDADFYIFRDRSQRRRAAVGHHRRRHEGARSIRPSTPKGCARSGPSRLNANEKTRNCCLLSSNRRLAAGAIPPVLPCDSSGARREPAEGVRNFYVVIAARSSYS